MNPLHDPRNYSARAGDRLGLGAILLMNLFERLQCGICGDSPLPRRSLKDAVQKIDPGYCIDAPDVMPAGGMFSMQCAPFPDDEEQWIPEQLIVEREQ